MSENRALFPLKAVMTDSTSLSLFSWNPPPHTAPGEAARSHPRGHCCHVTAINLTSLVRFPPMSLTSSSPQTSLLLITPSPTPSLFLFHPSLHSDSSTSPTTASTAPSPTTSHTLTTFKFSTSTTTISLDRFLSSSLRYRASCICTSMATTSSARSRPSTEPGIVFSSSLFPAMSSSSPSLQRLGTSPSFGSFTLATTTPTPATRDQKYVGA
ncbi:hypothetical protein PIB30_041475, partial [Stylosanthes scabra]|nr:hypothetical protein [Stylosanthes scabra]